MRNRTIWTMTNVPMDAIFSVNRRLAGQIASFNVPDCVTLKPMEPISTPAFRIDESGRVFVNVEVVEAGNMRVDVIVEGRTVSRVTLAAFDQLSCQLIRDPDAEEPLIVPRTGLSSEIVLRLVDEFGRPCGHLSVEVRTADDLIGIVRGVKGHGRIIHSLFCETNSGGQIRPFRLTLRDRESTRGLTAINVIPTEGWLEKMALFFDVEPSRGGVTTRGEETVEPETYTGAVEDGSGNGSSDSNRADKIRIGDLDTAPTFGGLRPALASADGLPIPPIPCHEVPEVVQVEEDEEIEPTVLPPIRLPTHGLGWPRPSKMPVPVMAGQKVKKSGWATFALRAAFIFVVVGLTLPFQRPSESNGFTKLTAVSGKKAAKPQVGPPPALILVGKKRIGEEVRSICALRDPRERCGESELLDAKATGEQTIVWSDCKGLSSGFGCVCRGTLEKNIFRFDVGGCRKRRL